MSMGDKGNAQAPSYGEEGHVGFLYLLLPAITLFLGLHALFEVLSLICIPLGVFRQRGTMMALVMYAQTPAYVLFIVALATTFLWWRRRLSGGQRPWPMSLSPCRQCLLLALILLATLLIPQTEFWLLEETAVSTPVAGSPPGLALLYSCEGRAPLWVLPVMRAMDYLRFRPLARIHPLLEDAPPWASFYLYVYVPLCWAWLYWFDGSSHLGRLVRLTAAILILHILSVVITYTGVFVAVSEGWFLSLAGNRIGVPGTVLLDTRGLLVAGRLDVLHSPWRPWPFPVLHALIVSGGLMSYLPLSALVRWASRRRKTSHQRAVVPPRSQASTASTE